MASTNDFACCLDACVLYPPSLRDLLMWLAVADAYEPRLTEEIHAEWIRSVLADNPEVTPAQLDRTRRLMNQVTPNCLVSGYKAYVPAITLPDANDRHVLAAAVKSGATLIVTFNLSDFPNTVLQGFGVQAVHPDTFLSSLLDEQKRAIFARGTKPPGIIIQSAQRRCRVHPNPQSKPSD